MPCAARSVRGGRRTQKSKKNRRLEGRCHRSRRGRRPHVRVGSRLARSNDARSRLGLILHRGLRSFCASARAQVGARAASALLAKGPTRGAAGWQWLGEKPESGRLLGAARTAGTHVLHWALAAAAAHAHAVDHEALFRLVAQATGLVRPAWARHAAQGGKLAVLPAAHAQQEAQHVCGRGGSAEGTDGGAACGSIPDCFFFHSSATYV